jgi:hypothetical protein
MFRLAMVGRDRWLVRPQLRAENRFTVFPELL